MAKARPRRKRQARQAALVRERLVAAVNPLQARFRTRVVQAGDPGRQNDAPAWARSRLQSLIGSRASAPGAKPALASVKEYVLSAPRAGEARRSFGPILAEMWAVSQPCAEPPNGGHRRPPRDDIAGVEPDGAAPGGTARLRTAGGRAGVHALVYLAKHRFACPGLEPYDFAASVPDGVRA